MPSETDELSGTQAISVAIVGRPNVGKSTLFNRLIGDERSIVHDMPGTTRDTIDTLVETPDGPVRFIDTAGMRRRAKEAQGAEYYSMVRALQAIDRATLTLLLVDASEGVTRQDQRLAERVDAAGNPVVVVLNKWDTLDTEARAKVRAHVADMLGFLSYAPALEVEREDREGCAEALARDRSGHRGLRQARPHRLPQPGARRCPGCPAGSKGGQGAVRDPGSHGPTDLHAVRVQGAPGDLPALPGAFHPGAVRLRADAAKAEGAPARQLSSLPWPPAG